MKFQYSYKEKYQMKKPFGMMEMVSRVKPLHGNSC